jgi:hypothetical protein
MEGEGSSNLLSDKIGQRISLWSTSRQRKLRIFLVSMACIEEEEF